MKNTILISGAIAVASLSTKIMVNLNHPLKVSTDSTKIVVCDTTGIRLDSCFANENKEVRFTKILPGKYDFMVFDKNNNKVQQFKKTYIEHPLMLTKFNVLPHVTTSNSYAIAEHVVPLGETRALYTSPSTYSWSFGDASTVPSVSGSSSMAISKSMTVPTGTYKLSTSKPSKVVLKNSTSIKSSRKVDKTRPISHEKDLVKDKSMDLESDDAEKLTKSGEGSARVLTAGIWNDLENWDKFESTHKATEISNIENLWGVHLLKHRFSVEILGKSKNPAIGMHVTLVDKRTGAKVWESYTDNRGKAELWNNIFSTDVTTDVKLKPIYELKISESGKEVSLGTIEPTGSTTSTYILTSEPTITPNVDISFVVDATGSMGDEIAYLKQELMDIMSQVQSASPCANVRMSSVFYRDRGDEYLTRKISFVSRIDDAIGFVNDQYAGGGGDFPEAVHSGLDEAINKLDWSNQSLAKIIFLVLDAPPHTENAPDMRKLLQQASEKGIKIIPITASGIDKSTEFCMKYLAAGTGGDYIYLTDHSGVGNSHIKPTGVTEDVDLLNVQLIKVIKKYTQWTNCKLEQSLPNPIEPRVDIFGSEQIQITLFPNPASQFVQIKANDSLTRIEILNLGGQILSSISSINSLEKSIQIDGFSDGLYIARVWIKNQFYTSKFLINKGVQMQQFPQKREPQLFED